MGFDHIWGTSSATLHACLSAKRCDVPCSTLMCTNLPCRCPCQRGGTVSDDKQDSLTADEFRRYSSPPCASLALQGVSPGDKPRLGTKTLSFHTWAMQTTPGSCHSCGASSARRQLVFLQACSISEWANNILTARVSHFLRLLLHRGPLFWTHCSRRSAWRRSCTR